METRNVSEMKIDEMFCAFTLFLALDVPICYCMSAHTMDVHWILNKIPARDWFDSFVIHAYIKPINRHVYQTVVCARKFYVICFHFDWTASLMNKSYANEMAFSTWRPQTKGDRENAAHTSTEVTQVTAHRFDANMANPWMQICRMIWVSWLNAAATNRQPKTIDFAFSVKAETLNSAPISN